MQSVLLVNLGTPDSPSVKYVRKYLAEFLTDGRVIDIYPLWRNLLVRGLIVPFRGPRSAKLYRHIWDAQNGSPLLHYSRVQQQLLQLELGERWVVALAMRYGNPSIAAALANLQKAKVTRIRVIPLFPQYASATTGSVHQQVMKLVSRWPVIPEISFVNSFHDQELLIHAFAAKGKKHHPGTCDHILFSFHGLPQRQLLKGDHTRAHCLKTTDCCKTINACNRHCYSAQCHHTASLIAQQLQLSPKDFTVCFQSRLGREPWLQPYTGDVIKRLAAEGNKRLLVFCPAFVADCLETLQEIGMEYREVFLAAGGEELQLVEGLNDSPLFTRALAALAGG